MISLCIIVLTLDGAMQLHALMQKDKWSHTATASSVIFPFNTLLHANERICKKDKESVVQSSLTRLFIFIFRLWTATTTTKKIGCNSLWKMRKGKKIIYWPRWLCPFWFWSADQNYWSWLMDKNHHGWALDRRPSACIIVMPKFFWLKEEFLRNR